MEIKISSLMNIEFGSEPVYGDSNKYIKTKTKSFGDIQIQVFKLKKYPQKMHHINVCHE